MTSAIQIKGIRDGLLVILGEGEWDQVEGSLLAHIDAQKDFLQGAKVTLEVGNHILKAADLGRLRDLLSDRGIQLKAVLSNSPTTERTAQALGLGFCWSGFGTTVANLPDLKAKLGIEAPWRIATTIALGYPKFKQKGIVPGSSGP